MTGLLLELAVKKERIGISNSEAITVQKISIQRHFEDLKHIVVEIILAKFEIKSLKEYLLFKNETPTSVANHRVTKMLEKITNVNFSYLSSLLLSNLQGPTFL